jgi:OmpA-OmpF porin, OOP family
MNKVLAIILSGLFVLAGSSVVSAEQDFKGSKDHPLLTRMPDFYIAEYKDTEFDSHKFLGQDKKAVSIEGHMYYILYHINKGAAEPGELKIRRNIQDALKKIGGNVVFDDNFNKTSTIVLQKDSKESWVEVRSYNNMYKLWIVEKQIMKQDIVANAEAMSNDINTTGHVSIYGIYFDTGKSEIKPESDAALAEIAKLLKNNNALNLYVVGHTDNTGSFDANMTLSKDRANAVMNALIMKYSIASSRLKAYGVSSLNPVASNKTEEGKAKNRRVELVEQ